MCLSHRCPPHPVLSEEATGKMPSGENQPQASLTHGSACAEGKQLEAGHSPGGEPGAAAHTECQGRRHHLLPGLRPGTGTRRELPNRTGPSPGQGDEGPTRDMKTHGHTAVQDAHSSSAGAGGTEGARDGAGQDGH